MRIFAAELRKTLTLRFFLILVVAVLANFLLFRHNLINSTFYYDQDTYVAAQRDIMAMDSGERLAFLQEKLEMLDACSQFEFDTNIGTDNQTQDASPYWKLYTSGEYLQYTDNLYAERSLIRKLQTEVQQVSGHRQTLEAIIQEAKTKTSVAIFAKPGTFFYRSQVATMERFEDLSDIVPVYDMSAGVLNFQTSAVTDLIGLMAILFFCTQMAIAEQKSGTLPILRATKRGRLPLIASKLIGAFVLALLVVCVLWGVNLAYCAGIFGLGDLSRPVQSLTGYATSTLRMSVGEYLAFFFLMKWVLYAIVGILCLVVGILCQEAMPTWLAVGGFLGIGYILSQVISPISSWNILRFVNISGLVFQTDWLSEYRNLNFFGFPVEVFTAACVLAAVFLAAGAVVLCWIFCRGKVSVLRLPRLRLGTPRWLPFRGRSTALFGHELWKLLVECGAALVLVLFLLINLQEPRMLFYGTDQLYYKNYMERLAGPMSEEKQAYLESESARFEEIHRQIAQLRQDYRDGKLTEAELSDLTQSLERGLMAEKVLTQQIYPLAERIEQLAREGREAHFVYEPGYLYLFGLDASHEKTGSAALVLAGVILCCSNVFALESTSGMLPVLNVSKRGRGATARCKLLICMACAAVIFLIAQIPDYWYVLENFGFPSLTAPLCSLEAFGAWDDSVSILGGIVIFELLRLVTVLSLTAVILLLGIWTRNQLITLAVSSGVLLMPVLLHLLEINFLDKVSFFLPMTATGLLTGRDPLLMSLLYYGTAAALGAASCLLVVRSAKRGYTM